MGYFVIKSASYVEPFTNLDLINIEVFSLKPKTKDELITSSTTRSFREAVLIVMNIFCCVFVN